MINQFINVTAHIIGYEVENVTFQFYDEYDGGRWYFKGFTEYEGEKEFHNLRAYVCGAGIALQFYSSYSHNWFNYGLIIQDDIKEAAL
jgi:ABC-type multidrug transport system permease subunit